MRTLRGRGHIVLGLVLAFTLLITLVVLWLGERMSDRSQTKSSEWLLPSVMTDVLEDLRARGYIEYSNEIDEDMVNLSVCGNCRSTDCRYVGLRRIGSYRAFAVCNRCGAGMEL